LNWIARTAYVDRIIKFGHRKRIMKLVANLSMLGRKPTGLGVYALNNLGILKEFDSVVISSDENFPCAVEVIASPRSIAIGAGRLAAVKRLLWLSKLTLAGEYIAYSPTHHGLPGVSGQVITIHDLISLRFPRQHYPQYLFFRYLMPRMLKRCVAVFTVSEATKSDIVQYYGYPAKNIFVVPNSVDERSFKIGKVNVDDPYLLIVGARYSHKNVQEMIYAHKSWSARYRLVVTSCTGSYRKFLEGLVKEYGLNDLIHFTEYLDSEQLLELYQGCAALVYPSKWEGFGIPPLEALACGRPVILSDIPAHREVIQDAGIYVSLGDQSSWSDAFEALSDNSYVSEKVQKGRERVKWFSKNRAVSMLKESLLAVAPTLGAAVRK